MTKLTYCIHNFICRTNCLLASLTSFVNLLLRLYLANIFFKSGLIKISNWTSTLYLFQYEYKVPLISYSLAAFLATFVELICSTTLALGFATRYSAFALLFMTAVMNYTYQEVPENYYWMLIFATLVVQGGKKISIDYLLKHKYCGQNCNCPCCNKSCSHGLCCPTETKKPNHHSTSKTSKKKK
jgi:putative oxidoreductase